MRTGVAHRAVDSRQEVVGVDQGHAAGEGGEVARHLLCLTRFGENLRENTGCDNRQSHQ